MQSNMDTSGSEYEQPSLPSSMRKRKRSTEHDSSRARKKRKPALNDLHKLLVTYRGLQQMQRELSEQLAICERQIAKHKLGSASGKSRRRGRHGRPYVFRRVQSPLREVAKVEEDPTPPTFWERVGEWWRRCW